MDQYRAEDHVEDQNFLHRFFTHTNQGSRRTRHNADGACVIDLLHSEFYRILTEQLAARFLCLIS